MECNINSGDDGLHHISSVKNRTGVLHNAGHDDAPDDDVARDNPGSPRPCFPCKVRLDL